MISSIRHSFFGRCGILGGIAGFSLTVLFLTGLSNSALARPEPDQEAVKAIAMELGYQSDKVSYIDANGSNRYEDGEILSLDVDCSEEFVRAVGAAARKHPHLAIKIGEALVLLSEDPDPDCLALLAAEIIRQVTSLKVAGDGKSVVEPHDGKSVIVPFDPESFDPEALLAAMAALMPDSAVIASFTEVALELMPSILFPHSEVNTNFVVNPPSSVEPDDETRPIPPDPGVVTPIRNR